VSTVVGWIVADDEHGPAPTNGARVVASPYARRLARDRGVPLARVTGTGPGGRVVAADVVQVPTRVATPVARAVAERLGVDLEGIPGTGPNGRIFKEDVEARTQGAPQEASDVGRSIPLRGMRKVIAERMHASLHEMAQLTLGAEVDMTAAVELRRHLLEAWVPEGVRVSLTDLVCRAAVKALASHPALNASVGSDSIQIHSDVHLGLAVAVPDGLLVPVIAGAERRSLAELSSETARLASACKDGGIGVAELDGATFTVTALGSSGIDFFTPVINPPNVAILGVGRVHDGVAWEGDRPVRRDVMTLSLTIDHRAVDGAPGAAFLATVRELLEQPYRLLV
jgi:pyruvate dehydrogenase E2 component (dihydrolipoamide acetyltransferase)